MSPAESSVEEVSRICVECEGAIEPELLAVFPTAEICLDCMGETQRRRLEEDLRTAQRVSRSLLPQGFSDAGLFELGVYYRPSRILSGDFYDFMRAGPSRVSLAVGDVAGKGISACLLMSGLQATLRTLESERFEPAELLTRANAQFVRAAQPGRFASVFFGVLDADRGTLVYANGGHNPPLVRRRGGRIDRLDPTGMVLGVFEGLAFQQSVCSLEPGDLIALYTDGISEAESPFGELFGEERIVENLERFGARPAQEVAERLAVALDRFAPGEPNDDRTLVICRRTRG